MKTNLLTLTIVAALGLSTAGWTAQAAPDQGAAAQGAAPPGAPGQGAAGQGAPMQGASRQGASQQRPPQQRAARQGAPRQRANTRSAKYSGGQGSTWKAGRDQHGFAGSYGKCRYNGFAGPGGFRLNRSC